jgi:hypothetical protein
LKYFVEHTLLGPSSDNYGMNSTTPKIRVKNLDLIVYAIEESTAEVNMQEKYILSISYAY